MLEVWVVFVVDDPVPVEAVSVASVAVVPLSPHAANATSVDASTQEEKQSL
jgi:hypothetical protein